MRAIVIDDSKAMRVILSQLLRELGFDVCDACDGADAIAKLANTGAVDLALVDWNMPVMAGIDFVRNVRGSDRYSAMRIMMVTTESDIENVQQALAAGADEYVMKPFTREIIVEKLGLLGIVRG